MPGEVSVVLEPTDLYVRGHKDEKISLLLIQDEGNGEKLHWEVWKSRKQKKGIPFDKNVFEKLMNE